MIEDQTSFQNKNTHHDVHPCNSYDKTPRMVMQDYFRAVASLDIHQILSVFDENALIETEQCVFKGQEKIKEFFENGILKFHKFYPEPGILLVEGNNVAVEITLHGDGKKRKVGDFFQIHHGVITKMVIYSGASEWAK